MTQPENEGRLRTPSPRRILASTGARRSTGPWTAATELETAVVEYRRTRRNLIAGFVGIGVAVIALPLLLVGTVLSIGPAETAAPAPAVGPAQTDVAIEGELKALLEARDILAAQNQRLEERLRDGQSQRRHFAEEKQALEGTLSAVREQVENQYDALASAKDQLIRQERVLADTRAELDRVTLAAIPPVHAQDPITRPSWTASIAPLWAEQVTAYEALAERRDHLVGAWQRTRREHAADLNWVTKTTEINFDRDEFLRRTEQLDQYLSQPLPAAPQLPQVSRRVDQARTPEPILAAFRDLQRSALAQAQALQEADSALATLERQLTVLGRERISTLARPTVRPVDAQIASLAVVRPDPPTVQSRPQPSTAPQAEWPMNALPLRDWDYRSHMSEFAEGMTYTFRVADADGERIVPFIPYDGWRELIDRLARDGQIDASRAAQLRDYPAFERFALSLPALQAAGLYVDRSVQFRRKP